MNKPWKTIVWTVVCVALMVFGYILGASGRTEQVHPSTGADLTSFWETWEMMETTFVNTTGEELPTEEERVWGAIEGLVDSYGDPHSDFLPPTEAELFTEETLGNFGGVGMEIDANEFGIVVVAPLKGTPAEQAGLRTGDVIAGVDGASTGDFSVDDAVSRIRGEIGTEVVLTIYRPETDEIFDVAITRANIEIPNVETELRSDGIFVIRVFNFSGTIVDQFRTSIREFSSSGSKKLIIDLRNNPGGFLDAAVDISSWFLPLGKVVVREVSGTSELIHRSKGYDVISDDTDVVILIDGGSASASELLAGALQESGVATLVGEQTFGKGSVQQIITIDDDTLLKLTIAKWLTPSGYSISENGLEPDIIVPFTIEDFENGVDPQMDAAVELLRS